MWDVQEIVTSYDHMNGLRVLVPFQGFILAPITKAFLLPEAPGMFFCPTKAIFSCRSKDELLGIWRGKVDSDTA
jgi:hypothetical protein